VNQGNVFVQATEPTSTWLNGDIWVDTDNGDLFVNFSGTANRKASLGDVIALGGGSGS